MAAAEVSPVMALRFLSPCCHSSSSSLERLTGGSHYGRQGKSTEVFAKDAADSSLGQR